MKKSRIYACELRSYREVAPPLCAVCERIGRCRSFRAWYKIRKREYVDFVVDIVRKFPDKYQLEVSFMAEKQQFVQIVDMATGAIERVTTLSEIESMSAEDKLALSRNKNLFVVTHRLEPIVKVELRKHVINEPMQFKVPEPKVESAPIEEITPQPVEAPKSRGRKK